MRRFTVSPSVRPLLILAAAALTGLVVWEAARLRQSMPVLRHQAAAVQELVGEMDRLDEALTATVRLAAVSGDPRWTERYRALESETRAVMDSLNAVAAPLREARPPEPPSPAGPGTLTALEDSALALVAAGDLAGAQAMLDGEAYSAAKVAYTGRKTRLLNEARAVVAEAERRTDRELTLATAVAALSMLLLLAVSVLGARTARDRRRLREELRRADERLRVIVEVAPVAIIRVDLEQRVQFWNPAAERIFGWRAAEVLGKPYPAMAVADSTSAGVLFSEGVGGKTLEGIEIRRLRKDGTPVDLRLWNAAVRNDEGEVVGLVGVLADVTEQRMLEQRLRLSQKLEAVGRLAGGIAHDFNNVLTAVRGHADLLLERLPEGDETTRDLREIRRNADRATQLTRQLLAFSRQQVLQPRVLDLGAVVENTETMLRRLIGEHILLRVTVEEGLWRVEADPTQIEQVLLNLAVNARDAMSDGGELHLRLENTVLSERYARSFPYQVHPGPYVRMVVTDTGHGMDEETRGRVFEPFFTTKGMTQGTGLGLATVFGIIKQSGGYIWVDSTPGAGTEFEVLLPRVEKPLPAPDPEAEAPADADGSETVLLVEDDHAVRELARKVLARRGYRVLEAASPSEALLRVIPDHGGPIDILVTDVVMPDMDGRALADRVSVVYPEIRTVFMSGYTEDEVIRRGITTGSAVFLQKPFTPPELTACVRRMLDRV